MSTIKAQVDLILGDGEDDVFEAGRWARNELAGPEGDLILRVIELHERGVEPSWIVDLLSAMVPPIVELKSPEWEAFVEIRKFEQEEAERFAWVFEGDRDREPGDLTH